MTDIEDDITSAVQQDWRPVYPNGPAGPAVAPLPLDHNLNPKDAIGRTKASVWAVPPTAVLYMGAALQDGAGKYGLFNWRDSAIDIGIYFDALFRHMCEFRDGEILDEDEPSIETAEWNANLAELLSDDVLRKIGGEVIDNVKADDDSREELQWFVEWSFVPWRGAYAIGLPHMIGGLSAAATRALRALPRHRSSDALRRPSCGSTSRDELDPVQTEAPEVPNDDATSVERVEPGLVGRLVALERQLARHRVLAGLAVCVKNVSVSSLLPDRVSLVPSAHPRLLVKLG